jgi:hypothetical protein
MTPSTFGAIEAGSSTAVEFEKYRAPWRSR